MLVAVVLLPLVWHTSVERLDSLNKGGQIIVSPEHFIGFHQCRTMAIVTRCRVGDVAIETAGKALSHFFIWESQRVEVYVLVVTLDGEIATLIEYW